MVIDAEALELIGSKCPFGRDSSTKHLSGMAACPDLDTVRKADQLIIWALGQFLRHHAETSASWRPVPAVGFSEIATMVRAYSSHAPSSLGDVVPIAMSRTAEAILGSMSCGSDPVSRALCATHNRPGRNITSNRQRAVEVMCEIRKRWHAMPAEGRSDEEHLVSLIEGGNELVRVGANSDGDRYLTLSQSVVKTLLTYQTMQERVDRGETVARINALLAERSEIIETILGIQMQVCWKLAKWMEEEPERYSLSRAFTEIVISTNGWPIVMPSTRFLKLIVHNWAEYFLDCSGSSPQDMLKHAIARAVEEKIYHQNIFVFRKIGTMNTLHGVTAKACPAMSFIGSLLQHYL